MKHHFSMVILAIMMSLLSSCAGMGNGSKTAAEFKGDLSLPKSVTSFVADKTPMADVQPWLDAANAEDPNAQFVVGMMYRDEMEGVKHIVDGSVSVEEADMFAEMIRWSTRSEDNDSELGRLAKRPSLIYEKSEFRKCPKDEKVLTWLEQAAAHGYRDSEYVLGLMYYNGTCVQTDKARGIELIQRSAYHGNAAAQYDIGMMYELGLETEPDMQRANAWLQKAADGGSVDAQLVMALKLLDGIGIEPNAKAAENYRKASEEHHWWSRILASDFAELQFDHVCTGDNDTVNYEYVDNDEGCGSESYDDDDNDDDTDDDANSDEDVEQEAPKPVRAHDVCCLDAAVRNSMEYSVDYELANEWLATIANGSNNHAMLLRLQGSMSSGCRANFTKSEESTIRNLSEELDWKRTQLLHQRILEQLVANGYPQGEQIAAGYYVREGILDQTGERISNTEYADKLVQLLAPEGKAVDPETYRYLGDIFYGEVNSGLPINDCRAYYYYKKADAPYALPYIAYRIGRDFYNDSKESYYDGADIKSLKKLDPIFTVDSNHYVDAFKWFQIAYQDAARLADHSEFYNTKYDETLYWLAHMYETGTGTTKNHNKAIEYFEYLFQYNLSKNPPVLNEYTFEALDALSEEFKRQNQPEEDIEDYYLIMNEICVYSSEIYKKHEKKCNQITKYFDERLELKGLAEAVELEIQKEKGKNANQFFMIKDAMNPCIEQNKSSSKDRGCDQLAYRVYSESILKSYRGVLALSDARLGKPVPEIALRAFLKVGYSTLNDSMPLNKRMLNNLLPLVESNTFKEFCSWSSVCTELAAPHEHLRKEQQVALLLSWYLRQIPYAAKKVYEKIKQPPKSWDTCLKEAEDMIRKEGLDRLVEVKF